MAVGARWCKHSSSDLNCVHISLVVPSSSVARVSSWLHFVFDVQMSTPAPSVVISIATTRMSCKGYAYICGTVVFKLVLPATVTLMNTHLLFLAKHVIDRLNQAE